MSKFLIETAHCLRYLAQVLNCEVRVQIQEFHGHNLVDKLAQWQSVFRTHLELSEQPVFHSITVIVWGLSNPIFVCSYSDET